jgi:hypothetical protein
MNFVSGHRKFVYRNYFCVQKKTVGHKANTLAPATVDLSRLDLCCFFLIIIFFVPKITENICSSPPMSPQTRKTSRGVQLAIQARENRR